MESSTTIRKMLAGNRIIVPSYQRAYSWDTDFDKKNSAKQVNVFLRDLEEYNVSLTKSPYYFGHFLFEETSVQNSSVETFGVIDGQQRLTTIVIFLAALFTRLKAIRVLTENEEASEENLIKYKSVYRFETVEYDRQLFKDYVINQNGHSPGSLETTSAKRIVRAFDFFTKALSDKDENYLLKMLESVSAATSTTHRVRSESEAIQMFIFQNNRGKKPSNLEIIKAQFMFVVHLQATHEKEEIISEIKERFERIYKSISSIESNISEDDVLTYTLQVYFNSLFESNALNRIYRKLADSNPVQFVRDFTLALDTSFKHLLTLFTHDEPKNQAIHSLVTLGGLGLAMPFIIKAYSFGLASDLLSQLCSSLESVLLRGRVIGTRADLTSRLNDVYANFIKTAPTTQPSIEPIIKRVEYLKSNPDWWYAYWNKAEFAKALRGQISHSTAKFLLWKYENHLESQGQSGYAPTRFDRIDRPELEHIAPQTPTDGEPIAAGYPAYDDEFKNEYLDSLGNYLLLSKSHNCSVGNKPFLDKRNSYSHNAQQREIQELSAADNLWTKELIEARKSSIISFVTGHL